MGYNLDVTTIAASIPHGYMAADTLTCAGDRIVSTRTTKIHRVNGCLIGCAGMIEDCIVFCDWFRDHDMSTRPKLDEHFSALVLSPRGLFMYWDTCVPVQQNEDYAAAGSGTDYALSAMRLGLDPRQAVRHAMEMDIATGGRVRCEYL